MMIYDIIGDVHGNAELLEELLSELGYRMSDNLFTHAERRAVFVGDFINRGKSSRRTLQIVRGMVESGNGYAILGNHELYAIIFNLKDRNGVPFGKNDSNLAISMKTTIKEFASSPSEWKSYRNWLRTLPLFLDFDNFRVVHAYWNDSYINYLKDNFSGSGIRKQVFREIYKNPDSVIGRIFWETTKGIDFEVPQDLRIRDNKGVFQKSFRMMWWDSLLGKTFEQISFEDKFRLPAYTVPPEIIPDIKPYPETAPIIFFGHYRRVNGPYIIRKNICCLDSGPGVSKVLTAYSWNGERVLDINNLVQVQ
jgi:hypothetical protein